MPSLFILGATGFIGSAFLVRIKQDLPELDITALVRCHRHIQSLQELGVSVVLGDANDMGKVVDLASKADIIVNTAFSDSIPLIQAILTGQRIHAETGQRSTLLHVSRTAHSLHQEEAHFLQLYTTIFDDMNLEWLAMPSDDKSRLVDREILEASQESYIHAFIISPTTVFGNAPRVVHRSSHEMFDLLRCAVAERYLLFPGEGRNVGNAIHLRDLVELFILILRRAGIEAPVHSEHKQFFFASGCAFSWSQLAETIAVMLHRRGILDSAQLYSCSAGLYPELRKYTKNYAVDSLRAQSLGWSPRPGVQIGTELQSEVDNLLAEIGSM